MDVSRSAPQGKCERREREGKENAKGLGGGKRGVCYQVPPSLAPGCVCVSMVSSWRCGSFSVLLLGVTPARVALLLSYPAPYTLESS